MYLLIIILFYNSKNILLLSYIFHRKLVENSKIEEQEYNNDCQSLDEKLLDVQLQNEKQQVNATYYVSIYLYLYKYYFNC